MDIVLERVLSLIPRKPNGKFVHGAKTEFAEKIGLNHPQIVSDWASGRSNSYRNYLYQISAVYNVSVEWLKGETDEKTKKAAPDSGDGQLTERQQQLFSMIQQMDDAELKLFLDIAQKLTGQQPSAPEQD